MRFTSVVVAGLMAFAAQAQDTTSSAKAPATTEATSEVVKCINACAPEDVNCIAHCTPVPSPNEGNLTDLHDCVGDCDQGSGSESDTIAYGNCVQECVKKNYYDPDVGTPNQPGAGTGSGSGSSSGNGDKSGDKSDDDKSSGSDSKSGDDKSDGSSDDDDAEDEESGDESAAPGLFASPVMALFGFVAAALTL